MKHLPLGLSLFLSSSTLCFGVTSFWSADTNEDPTLTATGWNATGGTNPDPTPANNGGSAVDGPTSIGFANVDNQTPLNSTLVSTTTSAPNGLWIGSDRAWGFNAGGIGALPQGATSDSFGQGANVNNFYGIGDISRQNASFDIWFSPTDPDQTSILFETGGAVDGAGLVLSGGDLIFGVSDNITNGSAIVSVALDDLGGSVDPGADPWYQARLIIQPGNQIGLSVYDGAGAQITAYSTWGGLDWAGGDTLGLAREAGSIGGDLGGQITNLAGLDGTNADNTAEIFEGYIARLEFAGGDMARLTAIPEPSRAMLLGLSLGTLLLRRRR